MFKIITSTSIIASQSSLEKRREVTLMMLPDGLLSSWRQRRSRRLCRQECHLHSHQRQSRQKKKFQLLSSGGLFVISKRAILMILLIKPKF